LPLSFVFAGANKHKFEEYQELQKKIPLKSSLVLPSSTLEVEETGQTLHENALLKANAYFEYFKHPSLSDDSGLFIKVLPEELGVQTARFGGNISQHEKNLLILEKLKDVPSREKGREASFHCVLCFKLSREECFLFEGKLEGEIALRQKGDRGFGYDPIFIPKGQKEHLAEIPEWKQEFSHRAMAWKRAKQFFSSSEKL